MAIYDCFQYFNEETVLDLRFNILNENVDFFVITESTVDHQGNSKSLNFDLKNFKKFQNKIIHIIVDDIQNEIKKPHEGQNSLVERNQRNSIMKGLKKCGDNDLIIISDVDEIPDLNKLNLLDTKSRYAVFCQKKFDYKLNLLNETEGDWFGSKICLKKNLRSPQWLRNLKFKKYPFWRVDKPKNIQIIQNGGWHFAYLQTAENISKKIRSFAHGEFNKEHFVNEEKIKDRIEKGEDIFQRGFKIKKINIDDTFPDYIQKNQNMLKNWIV